MMIRGSRSTQLNPLSFTAMATEYRKSENHLDVLTNRVRSGLELVHNSTPSGGQRRRIEESIIKLMGRKTEYVTKPPPLPFFDVLRYSHYIGAATKIIAYDRG
ncbi:unnamed protein product [Schistocephalus solidus]|uniref:Uncharacterized protein n=1 Tax=Schistocephalus solidus TaxID=70667 RepID=A0A183TC84_SCHSO|nr:unnamed protein product [Schistocephalus solidus]